MRFFNSSLVVSAIVFAFTLAGCSKQAPVATEATLAHDAAYYAAHTDEAKARDIACNKSKVAGETLSAEQTGDCDAARKAAHDADNPVYVPGKGKPFSSAGGTH